VSGKDTLRLEGNKLRKNVLIFPLVFLFTFLTLPISCIEAPATAKVIKVIDGDTIVVAGGYKVRYIGINAPEKGEAYYLEAYQANQRLVVGKKVRLEKDISDRDKHGRLLRYVYVDNIFVNAELVRQGYARARSYPPDIKYQSYLEAAEKEAQQERKGIWERK